MIQVPQQVPGLVYYYPTAIPLTSQAGYGAQAGVMTPTQMMRYRGAGASFLPHAAEMMDYATVYNGVSIEMFQKFYEKLSVIKISFAFLALAENETKVLGKIRQTFEKK